MGIQPREGGYTYNGQPIGNLNFVSIINNHRGFIRFDGGPWHNQHRKVEWMPVHRVPVVQPFLLVNPVEFDLSARPMVQTAQYRLMRLATDRGTIFYEYHVESY